VPNDLPGYVTSVSDSPQDFYIVGSGKTAMDSAIFMRTSKRSISSGHAVMIGGSGTWFINSDSTFETTWPNATMMIDFSRTVAAHFEGDNDAEVYRMFAQRGLLISLMDDAQACYFGSMSTSELEIARKSISSILRGYVVDVVADVADASSSVLVRKSNGSEFHERVPAGAVFLHCINRFPASTTLERPILDSSGLVCTPGLCLLSPGYSSFFVSHLFLRSDTPLARMDLRVVPPPGKGGRNFMITLLAIPYNLFQLSLADPSTALRVSKTHDYDRAEHGFFAWTMAAANLVRTIGFSALSLSLTNTWVRKAKTHTRAYNEHI